MKSLRGRLTATTLLATLGLICFSGLLLDHDVERQLLSSLDAELDSKAEIFIGLTEQEDGEVEVELADLYIPNLAREESVEIRLADGRVLARSSQLGETSLPADGRLSMKPRYRDLELPDGRPGRLIQVDFLPVLEGEGHTVLAEAAPPDHPSRQAGRQVVSALIAVDKSPTLAEIRGFRVTLGLVSLLLLAGLGVLVPWLVGRGLRPLTDLGSQVQRLDATNLGEPLVLAEPPLELRPLIARLDDLRGRLARSFERERRFSSDAAHELRTPIAELRVLAEVALRYPPEPSQNAELYRDALKTTLRMEHLAEQLLALARLDGAGAAPPRVRLRLAESVRAVVERRGAGAVCRLELPAAAELYTGETLFGLLLDNVIGNALDHRTAGTTVTIEATPAAAGGWRLACRNPTAELEKADLEHLYERFWRKDGARRGHHHSGLGLALVRSIAEALGIELAVSLEDGVFEIALGIPSPPAGHP